MKKIQLVSLVMAGVFSAGMVLAQEAADPGTGCCAMMHGMIGTHKQEMMQWHQEMMAKMKQQDAELDKLVQEMNAAKGDKKVAAIAAIINKVMADRKGWHEEMEARHQKMMEWMKSEQEKKQPSPSVAPSPTPAFTP